VHPSLRDKEVYYAPSQVTQTCDLTNPLRPLSLLSPLSPLSHRQP
jgi:hypothetical protein